MLLLVLVLAVSRLSTKKQSCYLEPVFGLLGEAGDAAGAPGRGVCRRRPSRHPLRRFDLRHGLEKARRFKQKK